MSTDHGPHLCVCMLSCCPCGQVQAGVQCELVHHIICIPVGVAGGEDRGSEIDGLRAPRMADSKGVVGLFVHRQVR